MENKTTDGGFYRGKKYHALKMIKTNLYNWLCKIVWIKYDRSGTDLQ